MTYNDARFMKSTRPGYRAELRRKQQARLRALERVAQAAATVAKAAEIGSSMPLCSSATVAELRSALAELERLVQ